MMNGNGGEENFEEVKIPVPWGHITGKWWGDRNVQPILAMHGWQDNAGTFDNLAPLLVQKGISIYCIDLPGHGLSSHIPKGEKYYLYWDGIHHVRRIVRHFKWNNITMIGHSLGGGIAFLYAATYPNEVKKFIGIDIAGPSIKNSAKMIDALGASLDKFLDFESKTLDDMPCYDYRTMVDIMEDAQNGSVNRRGCEILLRRGMRPASHKEGYLYNRDVRLKVAALGFLTLEHVLEFAGRITCEVMNIKASNRGERDYPEYYDLVLDRVENSAKKLERHFFEGTHHLHLNDAEQIAPSICDFLLS